MSDDVDDKLKIARLEVRVANLDKDLQEMMDKFNTQQAAILQELKEQKESRQRDKGFIGGVIFVISALWTVGTFYWLRFHS